MSTHSAALPHTNEAPRDARTAVGFLLDGQCDPAVIETAVLLTSELVSNAVRHATPPLHVRTEITAAAVRVEVHDSNHNDALPAPREAGPTDADGRGLAIVGALASGWGSQHTSAGKFVWFELSRP